MLLPISLYAGHVGAEPKKSAPPELAEHKADLGEVRQRIDNLRKELNASEEDRADIADRLHDAERKISRLQRELSELGNRRHHLQSRLQTLEQQSKELMHTLEQQQLRLEKLVNRQYTQATPDALRLLLNGDDPNQISRDLYYLAAIGQTRTELLAEIRANLERKKALAEEAAKQAESLLEIEQQQKERHAELQEQRAERQKLYAQISDKIKSQRKEIGRLQQDEKRLTQLVDRLARILAAQAAARAAEEAKKAEALRRAELAKRQDKRPTTGDKSVETTQEDKKPSSRTVENSFEPAPNNGQFARLRGQLRLPTRGAVAGKFGSPREGGGTWKGVFVRADTGREVKAIANGRVVFADWMRGFGNLLIIDHGDAYLSIYGNNDALLRQVGQAVKGGDQIATVGNSGGNPDSGLYFEIRHQGQPVDPLKWASLK